MIGEIYRYLRGTKIYGDDGYVLLRDQNPRYIFFPFLFLLCPVEIIGIDEESITQSQNISLIVVLHVAIGAVVAQGQIILLVEFGFLIYVCLCVNLMYLKPKTFLD